MDLLKMVEAARLKIKADAHYAEVTAEPEGRRFTKEEYMEQSAALADCMTAQACWDALAPALAKHGEELERIMELSAKATPGPWERTGRDGQGWIVLKSDLDYLVCSEEYLDDADAELIVTLRNLASVLEGES